MKYLMYYAGGFIKKFPLLTEGFTIGRSSDCDLVIDDAVFSRLHIKGLIDDDGVLLEDVNSTNGTFVDGVRISKKKLEMNRSFVIGDMRFYLKQGDLSEFAAAPELIPIFNEIAKDIPHSTMFQETRYLKDIYQEILKMLLSEGLTGGDLGHFMGLVAKHVENLLELGDMVLIKQQKDELSILFAVTKNPGVNSLMTTLMDTRDDLFSIAQEAQVIIGSARIFYSYPLLVSDSPAVMIYLPLSGKKDENQRILNFIRNLVKEIELLSIINGKHQRKTVPTVKPLDISQVEIVATSSVMKDLINQAKKISRSDIFVLIQGESGTGKELFARLIHEFSPRSANNFVGLNCAAIPENLLEAELFGSEKGAYTGAYTRKNGKLELASGGTLVLDEIGDMPLSVQTKLLRALQEHEFYRLGSDKPIHVDLRIISLTHRDVKQLIQEKKFREDLFYRLVHHTMNIPPLRERQEDIASLINYFTQKFCGKISKQINGFSIRAHHVLEQYAWPGNIRQLENEIKRLVNLADEGEVIGKDLLSEDIRQGGSMHAATAVTSGVSPCSATEQMLILLASCHWNKSEAARVLGITYQGLHKKIKRMGLEQAIREKRARVAP